MSGDGEGGAAFFSMSGLIGTGEWGRSFHSPSSGLAGDGDGDGGSATLLLLRLPRTGNGASDAVLLERARQGWRMVVVLLSSTFSSKTYIQMLKCSDMKHMFVISEGGHHCRVRKIGVALGLTVAYQMN